MNNPATLTGWTKIYPDTCGNKIQVSKVITEENKHTVIALSNIEGSKLLGYKYSGRWLTAWYSKIALEEEVANA